MAAGSVPIKEASTYASQRFGNLPKWSDTIVVSWYFVKLIFEYIHIAPLSKNKL
jgi:hypothetical protein